MILASQKKTDTVMFQVPEVDPDQGKILDGHVPGAGGGSNWMGLILVS